MNDTKRRLFLLAILTLSLSVLSGSVLAQSLAEVAEKEKERRAEVKGPTRVISDQDLRSGRRMAPLPSSSASAADGEEGAGSGGELAEGEELTTGEEPEVDETTTREYWQNRVTAVREKIATLEERLQSPEADWGGGIRTDVNPVGQRNLSHRQEIESELATARAELAQIQEEARRAGVPAGWVR